MIGLEILLSTQAIRWIIQSQPQLGLAFFRSLGRLLVSNFKFHQFRLTFAFALAGSFDKFKFRFAILNWFSSDSYSRGIFFLRGKRFILTGDHPEDLNKLCNAALPLQEQQEQQLTHTDDTISKQIKLLLRLQSTSFHTWQLSYTNHDLNCTKRLWPLPIKKKIPVNQVTHNHDTKRRSKKYNICKLHISAKCYVRVT